jgi:hypothetical protein
VPKIKTVDENNKPFFLTLSQKSDIINSMNDKRMVNMDIIPHDPVYTGVSIGLEELGGTPKTSDLETSFLVIRRTINERFSAVKIKENVIVNAPE